MIFVILGTQKFQFNRLLKELDVLVENGSLREEVFAQIGHSDYEPQHYQFKRFVNQEEFEQLIDCSSVVITHSGVGSIITAKKKNKPVLVVPRLSKFGEHVDDHQLEIAQAFSSNNQVVMCTEISGLSQAIQTVMNVELDPYVSHQSTAIEFINQYLRKLEMEANL